MANETKPARRFYLHTNTHSETEFRFEGERAFVTAEFRTTEMPATLARQHYTRMVAEGAKRGIAPCGPASRRGA